MQSWLCAMRNQALLEARAVSDRHSTAKMPKAVQPSNLSTAEPPKHLTNPWVHNCLEPLKWKCKCQPSVSNSFSEAAQRGSLNQKGLKKINQQLNTVLDQNREWSQNTQGRLMICTQTGEAGSQKGGRGDGCQSQSVSRALGGVQVAQVCSPEMWSDPDTLWLLHRTNKPENCSRNLSATDNEMLVHRDDAWTTQVFTHIPAPCLWGSSRDSSKQQALAQLPMLLDLTRHEKCPALARAQGRDLQSPSSQLLLGAAVSPNTGGGRPWLYLQHPGNWQRWNVLRPLVTSSTRAGENVIALGSF